MKHLSTAFIFLFIFSAGFAQTFHDYSGKTILGDSISFSQYSGTKLLVVNTASQCGFTYEYGPLEQLYAQYKGDNFAIIGFPSNDFNQETGNDSTINEFCDSLYHVTFQMMSKSHVAYGDTLPVYKWLSRKNLNGVANAVVTWNFNKFLVDEAGHWVNHFVQTVQPYDTAIVNWILRPSIYTDISTPSSKVEFMNNPVHNELNFNLINAVPQKVSVKLFSISGQEVGDVYEGNAAEMQTITYNTSALPSGIYIIRVESIASSQSIKVAVIN